MNKTSLVKVEGSLPSSEWGRQFRTLSFSPLRGTAGFSTKNWAGVKCVHMTTAPVLLHWFGSNQNLSLQQFQQFLTHQQAKRALQCTATSVIQTCTYESLTTQLCLHSKNCIACIFWKFHWCCHMYYTMEAIRKRLTVLLCVPLFRYRALNTRIPATTWLAAWA